MSAAVRIGLVGTTADFGHFLPLRPLHVNHLPRKNSATSGRIGEVRLVAKAEEFQNDREPPLRIGDIVRLNSGGPRCLIVDLPSGETLTVSWRDHDKKASEHEFPRTCVHRVPLAD